MGGPRQPNRTPKQRSGPRTGGAEIGLLLSQSGKQLPVEMPEGGRAAHSTVDADRARAARTRTRCGSLSGTEPYHLAKRVKVVSLWALAGSVRPVKHQTA